MAYVQVHSTVKYGNNVIDTPMQMHTVEIVRYDDDDVNVVQIAHYEQFEKAEKHALRLIEAINRLE